MYPNDKNTDLNDAKLEGYAGSESGEASRKPDDYGRNVHTGGTRNRGNGEKQPGSRTDRDLSETGAEDIETHDH